MKKRDISKRSLAVLEALAAMGQGNRRTIAAHLGTIDAQKVSSTLSRLFNIGLVGEPDRVGGGWTISSAGRELLLASDGENAETETIEPNEPEPDMNPAPETIEPEPEPDMNPAPETIEPEPEPDSPQIAELIRNLELELALDQVKRRLRTGHIPARAARVYRELLASLPPVIADELAPITALLDPQ